METLELKEMISREWRKENIIRLKTFSIRMQRLLIWYRHSADLKMQGFCRMKNIIWSFCY